MSGTTYKANGRVYTGTLDPEPYTGGTIHFVQGKANKTEGGSASATDGGIQIDHVVAYAEAFNSGLKDRTEKQRDAYYNDPDVLLAVQAQANNAKKDADAAGWMPSWSQFGCDYAALQIGIKAKYSLTVDRAEHDALASTLAQCPAQTVVSTSQVKALAHDLKYGAPASDEPAAPKYSADNLKGLTLLVDGKIWGGNDLADPSAMAWSGLPDGWTVADSTKDGVRTLAFTAPDGTVVCTVRVGTLHDADKPKADATGESADKTRVDAASGFRPLASTGVAIAGAAVAIVLLAAIGIALAMASRRK